MSYIKINEFQVLCAGTASPQDLNFNVTELVGKNIKWAIGEQVPLADALARAQPGDLIIEVANVDVADHWYVASLRANGEAMPRWFDPEAALLAALHAWLEASARACGRTRDFEESGFDATTLKYAAFDHPHILDALGFLKPEMSRRYYGVCLNEASRKRIDRWLWEIDGCERGGYRLWRDQHGWARIERVRL
jgi:hypothetical protein